MHAIDPLQQAVQRAEQIPLLAGLDTEARRAMLAAGQCVVRQPGETIIQQGRLSRRLWILVDGRCEVLLDVSTRPAPFLLATLEPMACFGEMSFFTNTPHSASVRAKTLVDLLSFDHATFDRIAAEHPETAWIVARNVIHSLSERLRRMDQWVADLAAGSEQPARRDELSQLRDKLFDGWKL